ncbi:MAG: universal stress protein [Aeromicrobium sp.]
MARPIVIGIVDKQPTALRFAVREARSRRLPLQVVHSTWIPTQAGDVYVGFEASDADRAAGRELLDEARRLVEHEAPDLEADYVLTGTPAEQVLQHAASEASSIVVGSDDVPWYDRLLRTRIAGHLALHAPCPVVVVPELSYPGEHEGDVVLTLDGDTAAEGPIGFAFEEASRREAALHVLHVTRLGVSADQAQHERADIAEVLAGWRERFPDVAVVQTFRHDDIEPAVLRATEQSSLVVMGRPHHHTVPFSASRSLAAEVVRHAHCPVAVVPSR